MRFAFFKKCCDALAEICGRADGSVLPYRRFDLGVELRAAGQSGAEYAVEVLRPEA